MIYGFHVTLEKYMTETYITVLSRPVPVLLICVGSLPHLTGPGSLHMLNCGHCWEVRGETSLAPDYDDHGEEVEVEDEADLQTHLIILTVTLNQLTHCVRE